MALILLLLTPMAAGLAWYWKSRLQLAPQKKYRNTAKTKAAATHSLKRECTERTAANNIQSNKFHSVSIQPKDNACTAANELGDKRYLTHLAPPIPLSNCDVAHCHCKYVHHSDRRDEDDDRRTVFGIQTKMYQQMGISDRRIRRGRRKDEVN